MADADAQEVSQRLVKTYLRAAPAAVVGWCGKQRVPFDVLAVLRRSCLYARRITAAICRAVCAADCLSSRKIEACRHPGPTAALAYLVC